MRWFVLLLRLHCCIHQPFIMAVILTNAKPPLQEVAKLGAKAAQIYGILWESAVMGVRYDKRKHLPWKLRRDCGGLTSWSKKALAAHIGSKRETVARAIDSLLDAGFITVVGLVSSTKGSPHHVYRVIHPDDLEAQRHVISLFDVPPSVRWKNYGVCRTKDTIYQWADEPSDSFDFWNDEANGLAPVEDDEPVLV